MNPKKKFVVVEGGRIVRNKHRRTPTRVRQDKESRQSAEARRLHDLERYGEQHVLEWAWYYNSQPWHTFERKGWLKPPKPWRKGMKYEKSARQRTRLEILRGVEVSFFGHKNSAHWDYF